MPKGRSLPRRMWDWLNEKNRAKLKFLGAGVVAIAGWFGYDGYHKAQVQKGCKNQTATATNGSVAVSGCDSQIELRGVKIGSPSADTPAANGSSPQTPQSTSTVPGSVTANQGSVAVEATDKAKVKVQDVEINKSP